MALQRMLTSKDDRLIERWLVRTDREQDYVDWERLQVNILCNAISRVSLKRPVPRRVKLRVDALDPFFNPRLS